MKKKIVSFLLAAAMLLTAQGIPTLAESADSWGEVESIGALSPANPVHHCTKQDDGTDTTDWSYVYFGSYPQTEVTGDDLTEEITWANYDANGDAWVNGTKYRRISKSDTNYDGYFGSSDYRYFKWQRIKWRVLENNGSTLFVVADKGLDCKDYHDPGTPTTWENCTLRTWLNGTFYNTAFSSSEQEAIAQKIIMNEDNSTYGTSGGNNTQDNVYLLSIAEVTNSEYGFCEDDSVYSASRWIQPSDYAHAMGAFTSTISGYEGNCWWWLRSPGSSTFYAANVGSNGNVDRYGTYVHYNYHAAVPALQINLSSDFWYTSDDGTSGEGGESTSSNPGNTPSNPVYDANNDTTAWSYVYFGSYPQAEVIGDALTEAIIGADYDVNGDAWVNGTKYRRISKSDTNYDGYFGSSDYRYFKWERIKWRVLENNGSTLFVMADQGLDCKYYHAPGTSITWENCTLRTWLNGTFYNTAFSSSEQETIVQKIIMNEDNSTYGTSGGNNTQDNVYLLSIAEVTNPEYGFCEDDSVYSASRWIQPSDYAHAMGAFTSTISGYEGNCWWWLRSPGSHTDYAADVNYDGYVKRNGGNLNISHLAVVPALQINLTSDLWYTSDDGTSGEGGSMGNKIPANPVYDASNDTTTWSYVYFGSYPQTEVTGDELTEAITGAAYDANGDAWVNGTKYRRASSSDSNNANYFGDSTYRYFKWERIKWRVLKNNGSTLFVVADQGLDCKDYNETNTSITWENCTLRTWLNGTFYNTAFSSSEQGAIVQQMVVNDDNPYYGTSGGNNTQDNVYLLSIAEVENPEYGFCESYSTYSASRWMQPSDYAHAMGAYTTTNSGYEGNCWWWLRSPGYDTRYAANVNFYGYVYRDGYYVNNIIDAVAPALQINLTSDLWYTFDDGTSGEGGSLGSGLLNPVHYCSKDNDGIDGTDWSYVYFGSYPQTEVTGAALTAAITGANYDSNGDAWVNGTKYRRISKSDANNDTYFGNSEYCYFKWERIKWKVLRNNGSTLFAVADQGLDCKLYNEENMSITWENCTLRTWLNGTFYDTAFSSDEQSTITQQTIVNGTNPYWGTEGGNNTQDKIYLLSIDEVTNPEYGFCESYNTNSASRQMQASDYAQARGASGGYGYWWLRSPGRIDSNAACVSYDGQVNQNGGNVLFSVVAVVPALQINLTTDLWSTVDDKTSGEGGSMGNEISILSNPADQTVKEGTSATFGITVNAGKSSEYTCQWYYAASQSGTGTKINGAAASSYTIPADSVTAALDGRYYYCVVSDGEHEVTSGRAKLTVSKENTGSGSSGDTDDNNPGSGSSSGDTDNNNPGSGSSSGDTDNNNPSSGSSSGNTDDNNPDSGSSSGNTDNNTPDSGSSSGNTDNNNPGSGSQGNINGDSPGSNSSGNTETAGGAGNSGNGSGSISSGSGTAPNTPPTSAAKLPAPKLTIKLSASNTIKLSWNRISGAAGYTIYRATAKNGSYSKLKSTAGTSYADQKLKNGKTYYYKVEAYSSTAVSAKSNAVSKKIIGKPASPKQNVIKVNASSKKFTISWKKPKNATKVIIYRRVDNGKFKKWKVAAAKKMKASYSYKNYARGHRYSFQLRAYYKQDGVTVYSGYSEDIYTIVM